MKRKSIILILLLAFLPAFTLSAQHMVIKTNALYDLTTTINLGLEVKLSPQWSLDVTGNYNPWEFKDYRKQKQWMVQPEARYWFCETFNGHFLGLHLMTGVFNMANPFFPFSLYECLRDNRYEGNFYGAGIGYGYSFILSRRVSIEGEIGIGYMGTKYDQYECVKCGTIRSSGFSNQFALTKLSIALVIALF